MNLVRHTFKVRMPDGKTVVEVEKWATDCKAARLHVENFVAMHWPGAKVEP